MMKRREWNRICLGVQEEQNGRTIAKGGGAGEGGGGAEAED